MMKRYFFLIVSVLLMGHAVAQEVDETFQFVDEQGNIVPDGAVITVSSLNEEGQMVVPLFVKKASDEKAAVSLYETIDDLPNGTWQTCAFGSCVILSASGYSPRAIIYDQELQDIQTEWIPEQGMYASWTAQLQVRRMNTQSKFGVEQAGTLVLGYGPTVTVQFVYADPASISHATLPAGTQEHYFTLGGRQTTRLQQGLNILRRADGSVVKRIVK